MNRNWAPKRAEGNFGLFSYLESSTKILYDIEKLEQFAGFSVYTNNETARQIGICKGGFTMKKIGLGIAILLFAIIISLCSSGMGLLVIGIGIVGLIFSTIGFMERK